MKALGVSEGVSMRMQFERAHSILMEWTETRVVKFFNALRRRMLGGSLEAEDKEDTDDLDDSRLYDSGDCLQIWIVSDGDGSSDLF